MLITLPRSFGAALLRKRARPAPRRPRVKATYQTLLIEWAEELGYVGDFDDLQAMANYVWTTGHEAGREVVEELVAMGVIYAP